MKFADGCVQLDSLRTCWADVFSPAHERNTVHTLVSKNGCMLIHVMVELCFMKRLLAVSLFRQAMWCVSGRLEDKLQAKLRDEGASRAH